MSAQDLRKRAEECVMQAEAATNEADKIMFLRMADTWLKLAQQNDTIASVVATSTDPETGDDEQPTS